MTQDNNRFFEHPILNSPYEYPARHWELDAQGQPTQQIIQKRRGAEFITPIPKPRKHKGAGEQSQIVFDDRCRGGSTSMTGHSFRKPRFPTHAGLDLYRKQPFPIHVPLTVQSLPTNSNQRKSHE